MIKTIHRIRYWVTWVGLFAFLLIGVSSFQEMVLCFEPDGRVSLENAIGGTCSDSFLEVQRLQSKTSNKPAIFPGTHHKRCIDVPISIESEEHQVQKTQVLQSSVDIPPLAEAPTINVGYFAIITQQQLPQPPPLPSAIHRLLSTIVLLI